MKGRLLHCIVLGKCKGDGKEIVPSIYNVSNLRDYLHCILLTPAKHSANEKVCTAGQNCNPFMIFFKASVFFIVVSVF